MEKSDLENLLAQRPQISAALVESLDDAINRLRSCVHFSRYRGVPLRNFLSGGSGTFDAIALDPLQDICDRGAIKICENATLEVGNLRALVMLINHLAEVDPAPEMSSETTGAPVGPAPLEVGERAQDKAPPSQENAQEVSGISPESKENVSGVQEQDPCIAGGAVGERNGSASAGASSHIAAHAQTSIQTRTEERAGAQTYQDQRLGVGEHDAQIREAKSQGQGVESRVASGESTRPEVLAELIRVSSSPQVPTSAAIEFFPSYARILVGHLRDLSSSGRGQKSSTFISVLLDRVSQQLRDEELVVFWFASEHGLEPAIALFGVSREWALSCLARVRELVTQAVEELAPNIIEALTLALHAPLIPLSSLLRCLDADKTDTVSVVVGKMVLCALGAREGIFPQAPVRGLWSVQEKAVHILLNAVLVALPAPDEWVQRELMTLFPVLDRDQRIDLLSRFAHYHTELNQWQRKVSP